MAKKLDAPSYRLPEMLVKQERFDEALHEYKKIAERHPQEIRPILGELTIVLLSFKDPIRASEIYTEATGKIQDRDLRYELWRKYREIGARLNLDEVYGSSGDKTATDDADPEA